MIIPDQKADLGLSQYYAFTITLKPQLYKYKVQEQFRRTEMLVRTAVKRMGPSTIVAELTKNGNLHYHGMLRFYWYDKPEKCLCTQRFHDILREIPQLGHRNITPVTDEQGWIDYLKKSNEEYRYTIGGSPVITDDLVLFETFPLLMLGGTR